MTQESIHTNPDISEVLRMTIGQEADYYIRQMHELEPDKFAVIKVGGETVQNDIELLASDIAMLTSIDLYPVVVHGGGPQINADLEARGIEPKKHDGIRITDEQTLESVQRGLLTVNKAITDALTEKGVKTASITQGVFRAKFKDKDNLGHVGDVEEVTTEEITSAIQEGRVPIVSCLGADNEGNALNINGDSAARALCIRMQPHRFIILTGVAGVLDRDGQVISVLNDTQEIDKLIDDGTISEGMIPKVRDGMSVLHDLPHDSSVVITNPQQLIKELFTHQGGGTLLRHGDAISHLPSIDAVDQKQVRELIEDAFNKQLVDDYFDQLPEDAEVFITDRGYRGIAIVIPSEDGHPAYMDKLIVRKEERGHGVGDELVDKVREAHPEGVFWRVRKDNPALPWYLSKGHGQPYDFGGEWIVFFTEEVKPDARAMYASAAVLREQTVIHYANDDQPL